MATLSTFSFCLVVFWCVIYCHLTRRASYYSLHYLMQSPLLHLSFIFFSARCSLLSTLIASTLISSATVHTHCAISLFSRLRLPILQRPKSSARKFRFFIYLRYPAAFLLLICRQQSFSVASAVAGAVQSPIASAD